MIVALPGLFSYLFYRSFIPIFSHIAAPLTELTKKGKSNKVHWNEPQQKAGI